MNPDTTSESQRFIAQNHAKHNKRYAKAVALIGVAVLAGVVIGVGASAIYYKKYYHRIPPKTDAIVESVMGHMNGLLSLKTDEAAKIKGILDTHLGEVDDIRKQAFADSQKVFDRMREDVAEILGPERSKKWEEFKKERWGNKKHRGGRGGGMGRRM